MIKEISLWVFTLFYCDVKISITLLKKSSAFPGNCSTAVDAQEKLCVKNTYFLGGYLLNYIISRKAIVRVFKSPVKI